jgi:hypothetical protein
MFVGRYLKCVSQRIVTNGQVTSMSFNNTRGITRFKRLARTVILSWPCMFPSIGKICVADRTHDQTDWPVYDAATLTTSHEHPKPAK